MKHCYHFLILCLLTAVSVQAQQIPLFTQYRENFSLINPAIINADRMAYDFTPTSKASLGYRRQWTKIPDAPRTVSGQYEHLFEDRNMGLGMYMTSDALGPISNTGITIRYNYQAYFSNTTYLSIGIATGANQFSFRGSEGRFDQPGDYVGFLDYNRILWDFNVGASFVSEMNNSDVLYAGISLPQAYTAAFKSGEDPTTGLPNSGSKDFNVYRKAHQYFLLGYYKYLSDGLGGIGESIFLEPSVWVKHVQNAPIQAMGMLRFQMTNTFWFGGGVSGSQLDKTRLDNIHFEAGFNVQSQQYNSDRAMKIGFGYDTNSSAYGGVNLGAAFEVNMTYSWVR